MLKRLRIIISILLFALITFYFLDFAEILPSKLHVLAHIQLIPAILSGSIIILLVLVALTLAFGRIYCSSVCPMGIFQDIVSWISKRTAKRRKRYKYSSAKNILRWPVIVVAAITFVLGFPLLLSLVEPYSAYGRIIVNVFKPIYLAGNNLMESIFTSFGNYTFYKTDVVILSTTAFITGILTFFIIAFLAWKYGRLYCNTICPTGTLLGILSKYSYFKIRINNNKCNHCGVCESKCKSLCIDSKIEKIDHSRCVDCFNCLSGCKQNAISFTKPLKVKKHFEPVDTNKRQFLLTTTATAVSIPTLFAQQKTNILLGRKSYIRKNPISPPGSIGIPHLQLHCTSCHLCISKCPSKVLKPAFMEYGIAGIMQPMMYFEKGFCNFDCTVCSSICPNHALKPLTIEQKHLTQVGHVIFNEDICIVHTEGTNCGACAEHCPTQAVTMVPYKDGLTIPSVDPEICVGCGGCEFICPVRPHRAIHVEGNEIHQKAKPFTVEEKKEIEINDFGF